MAGIEVGCESIQFSFLNSGIAEVGTYRLFHMNGRTAVSGGSAVCDGRIELQLKDRTGDEKHVTKLGMCVRRLCSSK